MSPESSGAGIQQEPEKRKREKEKKKSILTRSSCQQGIGRAHENHYQPPDRPDGGGAAAHSASIKGRRPFKTRKKLQHVQLMDTKPHVSLSLRPGRQPVCCSPSLHLSVHLCFSSTPPLLFSFSFPASPLFSPFPPFFILPLGGGGVITPEPESFDQLEPRCFYRATVFLAAWLWKGSPLCCSQIYNFPHLFLLLFSLHLTGSSGSRQTFPTLPLLVPFSVWKVSRGPVQLPRGCAVTS